MTEVERLEKELETVRTAITNTASQYYDYRRQERNLQMDLNRARRLEREAKELQK